MVQDLESLLEKKQTPKKVKKCIAASQGKSPSNTETLPARKQPSSPKAECKPLTLKGQQRQEHRKPAAARSLLPGLYFELLNRFYYQLTICSSDSLGQKLSASGGLVVHCFQLLPWDVRHAAFSASLCCHYYRVLHGFIPFLWLCTALGLFYCSGHLNGALNGASA